MIPIRGHSGKGKTLDSRNISGYQRLGGGGGGMNGQSTEDFQGSENTLSDTIMVDTCHYTFI